MRAFEDVEVGQQLPPQTQTIEQADLIRYAGASGDFNPLHWDQAFAARVSPTGGIIAHGMLNMGLLSRLVTEWAGGPAHVRSITAGFRAPCPVGETVTVGAEVTAVDAATRTATLAIWVQLPDGSRVIDRRRSSAVVQLG